MMHTLILIGLGFVVGFIAGAVAVWRWMDGAMADAVGRGLGW